MNFEHTDDRRMLADSLSRYLTGKYALPVRLKAAASDTGFDADVWSGLAELGVIGALISEDHGGFGGKGFDISVVFEELGRALVVEPVLATGILGAGCVAELGSDSQRAMLEDVVAGSRKLALAHGEPEARYDLAHVTTKAEGGRITGRKSVVFNAATADMLVVSARTSGEAGDEAGISLYLVDPKASGVIIREAPSVDGGRVADVFLDGVEGEALGAEGEAYPTLELVAARATLALCAEALGAMQTAQAMTLDYVKQRKQFGRAIGTFQVLQHRLVDCGIEIEQARSAVINAAGHLEGPRLMREKMVSAAKNLVGRAGRHVAEEAIQIHGGIAMTWEYAVGHYAKRVVMIDHVFGDSDHHLERFIRLGRAA